MHTQSLTAAAAYIEAHIEQGPILEATGHTIGVVTGIQGSRRYTVEVIGAEAHAGTVPLRTRQDALKAAVSMSTPSKTSWRTTQTRSALRWAALTCSRAHRTLCRAVPSSPSTFGTPSRPPSNG